jgi:hypothetical protein
MSETAQSKFACPSCGRQFTWKPELAGRSAKCKCGATVKIPAQPTSAAPQAKRAAPSAGATAPQGDGGNPLDGYDFIAAAAAAAPVADAGLRCPSCGGAMLPGAVICVSCGFNLKTGKRMSTVMGGPDADAAVPAAATVSGAPAFPGVPGRGSKRAEKSGPDVGGILKLVLIPVLLIAVVGGAVFGYRKLAGEKDTGPSLGDDKHVRQMMKDDGATELKQWLAEGKTRMVTGMTREQADGLADRLYGMGAIKVYAFGGVATMSIAIELPPEKDKRDKIFEWYKKKYEEHTSAAERVQDVGQKYLLVHTGL